LQGTIDWILRVLPKREGGLLISVINCAETTENICARVLSFYNETDKLYLDTMPLLPYSKIKCPPRCRKAC